MECFVKVVDVQLFDAKVTFGISSSYIINQYVYSLIFIHGKINQLFATLEFGGGEIDMTHVSPCVREFVGKLLRSFLGMVSDDYFASFGDNAACGCFADTTGGTGDDNYFIFESVHIMGI